MIRKLKMCYINPVSRLCQGKFSVIYENVLDMYQLLILMSISRYTIFVSITP